MDKLKLRITLILIIFTSLLLISTKEANAETALLMEAEAINYETISGLTAEGILATEATFDDENEIATTYVLGYTFEGENTIYNLYSSTDRINYSSKNITEILKGLTDVDEGTKVIPTLMYGIDLNVYITCDIVDENNNVTNSIIKINNGEYSLVTMPDIEQNYYEFGIYKYDNNYVYAGYKVIDENQTIYTYYTTKDFETWTEKQIDLNLFKEKPEVVGILAIHSTGISFVGSLEGKNNGILITEDYENYTVVDESYINSENDAMGYQNIRLIREEVKDENLDYSMIIAYDTIAEVNDNGENVYSGFTIYLSEVYPNEYSKIIECKEKWKSIQGYYSWSPEDTVSSPIMVFVDETEDSYLYLFEDYRDETYTKYETEIKSEKIKGILRNDKLRNFILYDNKYLICSNTNFKTAYRTELPGEFTDMCFDAVGGVIFVSDTQSILVKTKDISEIESTKVNIENCLISGFSRNVYYTGEEIKQDEVKLEYNGYTLKEGTDYTVDYVDNINVGWGIMTIKGDGNYTGTSSKTFMIRPAAVTNLKKVSRSTTTIKFSWENTTPGVYGYKIYKYDFNTKTYKYLAKTTSTSYTAKKLETGSTNLFKVIPYIIVDDTQYNGAESSILKEVTQPTKTTITLKAGSKKATITWKRPRGVNGYEIYMKQGSTGSWRRVKTITSASTLKYTKSSLKKGKRYYFKVRSYKYLDGQKIYSPWSATKSVVVK